MSSKVKTKLKVQTAAQRLEYLLRKRKINVFNKANNKSRIILFSDWLENVTVEDIAKSTSLKDISTTARRLLLNSDEEFEDGKDSLFQWSKPGRQQSSRFKSISINKKKGNLQLLKESTKEIEIWLFSIAIYILWKKELKRDEALALCSRVIGITSTYIYNIATMSPRSHKEREDNDDKKSALKILKSNLQTYETLISQECVKSYQDSDEEQKYSSFKHKQRMESLKRRMEFNKQRLNSLKTELDFKANLMSFHLVDRTTEKDEKEKVFNFLSPKDRAVATLSDILYPHLVYHPYFNEY